MTLVALNERERVRDRARVRPNAPGNYITDQRFATVISLTLTPSPENYIKWWPYVFPETKAIGYVDNPTPEPAWVPVGPVNSPDPVLSFSEALIPGQAPIAALPIGVPDIGVPIPTGIGIATPEPIDISIPTSPAVGPQTTPDGSTLTAETAHKAGRTFTQSVGISIVQLSTSKFPIRGLNILSDDANAGNIFVGYDTQVAIDNGYKLIPGAAKDFFIDNLSDIFLIASLAAQKVHVEYTQ